MIEQDTDRTRWRWPRPLPGRVRIENDVIKIERDQWEWYYPFDFPSLANALAKADHREAALAFVQRYGLLGYSGLRVDAHPGSENYWRSYPWDGDPIAWFLSHASSVRFALHLIAMLHTDNDAALGEYIKSQMIVPSASDGERAPVHLFAERLDRVFRTLPDPNQWEGRYYTLAELMIVDLVNANTVGVRHRLFRNIFKGTKKQDRIYSVFSARALIEAIWHLVGQTAISSKQSPFSGVRLCEECGAPFIVTDKRQRFCPGDEFSGASLCGVRARMRRKRERDERSDQNA